MIAISTLLPLASLALKLGSKLLGDGTPQAKAEPPAQEERLAPTVQSLFQRLGVKDANSEQNRPAINHFMGTLMQTTGQEFSGQSLPRPSTPPAPSWPTAPRAPASMRCRASSTPSRAPLATATSTSISYSTPSSRPCPTARGKASASCSMPAREMVRNASEMWVAVGDEPVNQLSGSVFVWM